MERGYNNLFIMYLGHLITKKSNIGRDLQAKKILVSSCFFKRF